MFSKRSESSLPICIFPTTKFTFDEGSSLRKNNSSNNTADVMNFSGRITLFSRFSF